MEAYLHSSTELCQNLRCLLAGYCDCENTPLCDSLGRRLGDHLRNAFGSNLPVLEYLVVKDER